MSEHVESTKVYFAVFAGLIFLTVITTAVAFVDLGSLSAAAALAIATCKALLVALWFMHLRHSTKLTKLVVVGAVLWLAIMLVFTMADLVTRGSLGVPGR